MKRAVQLRRYPTVEENSADACSQWTADAGAAAWETARRTGIHYVPR